MAKKKPAATSKPKTVSNATPKEDDGILWDGTGNPGKPWEGSQDTQTEPNEPFPTATSNEREASTKEDNGQTKEQAASTWDDDSTPQIGSIDQKENAGDRFHRTEAGKQENEGLNEADARTTQLDTSDKSLNQGDRFQQDNTLDAGTNENARPDVGTTQAGAKQTVSNDTHKQTGQTNGQADNQPDRTDSETDSENTPQPESTEQSKNAGDVPFIVAETATEYGKSAVESVLPSHARLPGEGRAAFWERTRKALRAAGIPRGQGPGTAYEMATRETERLFPPKLPPPEPVIVEEFPEDPEPEAIEPAAEPEKPVPEPVSAPPAADQGVAGLGDFPKDWPKLPANAQLQVEIAWVTANRLLVRDGSGVNLSRAMSPPPSYSTLSWLETSILFPSKFAEISVKASATQDDEKEHIKREKFAIEEIRSILAEMLEAKD